MTFSKYNQANPKGGGEGTPKSESTMASQLTTKHDNINLIRLMIYDLETRTHDIPSFLYPQIV